MLRLKNKNKHHLSLPRFIFSHPELLFSPIPVDNDELIQEIEDSHGEKWSLSREPDVYGIETYWQNVSHDIEQDPEWFQFDTE